MATQTMAKTTKKSFIPKLILVGLIFGVAFIVFKFNLTQYLSIEFIKQQKETIFAFYQENQFLTILIYFAIYILATALSIPGATVLTLAGGFVFGLVKGTIIISFASTIGATIAFLISRYLFRATIQNKFESYLTKFNEGIEKEGAFYLFSLRLIPVIPFFLINLVMGLTKMKALTYFFVSQAGMLLGTIAYVNAGTELGKITSLKGILSPTLILSFIVIGLLPIISKKLLHFFGSSGKSVGKNR